MTDSGKRELKLSGSNLAELMRSVLDRGASFRFQAKGSSMSPFIRDRDIITISTTENTKPRTGDVAAVVNPANGAVIVHRIIAETGDGILLKGDNLGAPDGTFSHSGVIGLVTNIERNGAKVGFCSRPAKKIIALASGSGILNVLILPLLRRLKKLIS